MLGFIRRFIFSDFGPPPPPDSAQQPSFPGQRIIETICSDSKQQRVFITVDETGDYRIYLQWWDTSDWKAGYGARWSHVHHSGSHTDMIERARELAYEQLGSPRWATNKSPSQPPLALFACIAAALRHQIQTYFPAAPKTVFNTSLVRASGLARMFFSSAATILNRPSSALLAT